MELTLWNERAVGTDFQFGAVVFLKKARFSQLPFASRGAV